jgi:hypothetical protein
MIKEMVDFLLLMRSGNFGEEIGKVKNQEIHLSLEEDIIVVINGHLSIQIGMTEMEI